MVEEDLKLGELFRYVRFALSGFCLPFLLTSVFPSPLSLQNMAREMSAR